MEVALAIEVVTALILLIFVAKKPKFVGCICLLIAVGVGYKQTTTEVTLVRGTALVQGKTEQTAAVFSVGDGKHGVVVSSNVPIVESHKSSEVLVRVTAAGLNPSNFKIIPAKIPFVRHFLTNQIVGYDVAGVVLSVGSSAGCNHVKMGDKVYGLSGGSLAHYTVMACSAASRAPNNLSDEQAAGLPVAAFTSFEALQRGSIETSLVGSSFGGNSQKVLVIGASGGCGVYGVALAKVHGAHVTAICSTRNVEFVKKLGADTVVDYTDAKAMEELQMNGQFDIIYDTVTSPAPEDPNYEPGMYPLLSEHGRYIAINGFASDWVRGMADKFLVVPVVNFVRTKILQKAPVLSAIQRQKYDLFLLTPNLENIMLISQFFESGKLRADLHAPIDSSYQLSQDGVDAAFDRMKSRRAVGKIVFKISDSAVSI